MIVVDSHGDMRTASAGDLTILKWCQETQVEWHDIAPGKPMQNGFVESFMAASAPSLNETLLSSLARALGDIIALSVTECQNFFTPQDICPALGQQQPQV